MDGAIVTEGSVQIFSDMKWFRNLASTAIVNIAVGELCVKNMFWPMRWQGPLDKPKPDSTEFGVQAFTNLFA